MKELTPDAAFITDVEAQEYQIDAVEAATIAQRKLAFTTREVSHAAGPIPIPLRLSMGDPLKDPGPSLSDAAKAVCDIDTREAELEGRLPIGPHDR